MAIDPKHFEPMTEEEEAEMIRSSEAGEWVSIGNIEEHRKAFKQIALNTLNSKRKRISLAVPENDLQILREKAAREGIPYQTLINSLIHKYVAQP